MKKCLISVGLIFMLNPIAALAVAPVEDYSEAATEVQDDGISLSSSSASGVGSRSIPDRLRVLESKVDNLSQANLTARIEELQQTIAELRGQLEKQSHDLEQLTANQKSNSQDVNSRVVQSSATPAAAEASTDAAAPVAAESSPKPTNANIPLSERIKASSLGNVKTSSKSTSLETNQTPSVTKPSAAVPPAEKVANVSSQTSNPTAVGEQGLYQQAFSLLKSKQYDRALTQFKEYITKYPKGNYAVNAHFWMGEINYLQGKHSAAKKSFETVVKNYPKDKKIPDAMLKLAVIATDTGHKSQAEEMLGQIQKQYPGTTAAKLAMIRSQELRLSAH